MRTKAAMAMVVMVLAAILTPNQALANNAEVVATKTRLEGLVEAFIARCQAKSALRSSRSDKIRRSATQSCMKADYCRRFKDDLVEAMLEKNIEPKAYKVHHFLNGKFNRTLQAKE
ncbi:MAG: hypothetical protein PVH85_04105 [Desulfobacterales bacterium]|jgi:exonuclease V gamma subunit